MKEQTVSGSNKNLHSPKLNTRLIEAKKKWRGRKEEGEKKKERLNNHPQLSPR